MIYSIQNSLSIKEIGIHYPQIQKMRNGYDYEARNSVYQLTYDKLPKKKLDLKGLILPYRANLTDMLSVAFSSGSILLHKRVIEIFKKFNLPEYRTYPTEIWFNNSKNQDYCFFQYICDLAESIEFSLSEFYIKSLVGVKLEEVKIQSFKEYKKTYKQLTHCNYEKTIGVGRIILKNIPNNYDLFYLPRMDVNHYITERLKDALTNEEVTGIEFQESNIMVLK